MAGQKGLILRPFCMRSEMDGAAGVPYRSEEGGICDLAEVSAQKHLRGYFPRSQMGDHSA